MERVYSFTNENLTGLSSLYNFENAKVLSVLGSGDQYFTAVLKGAKEIVLFDNNIDAWDYFRFKLNALKHFSYGQFYDAFLTFECFYEEEYEHSRDLLSQEDAKKMDELKDVCGNLNMLLKYSDLPLLRYGRGINIPYLDYDAYKELQLRLREMPEPKFHPVDILKLPEVLDSMKYDVILTSNILQWIGGRFEDPIMDYRVFLEQFDCPEIQAMYTWRIQDEFKKEFIDKGYVIDTILPAKKSSNNENYVLSLRRGASNGTH
jgi:hypothetical protein